MVAGHVRELVARDGPDRLPVDLHVDDLVVGVGRRDGEGPQP